MSGHSHWATIKHKKAAVDAKKGRAFSKVAKLIMSTARAGADPAFNIRLRQAIEKAQSNNMPREKIENAIKKGSGQLEGFSLVEVSYEGYSPGGIAILVDALTDNRNRTTPEIRHIFEKRGGTMGGPNSVARKFKPRGLFLLSGVTIEEDKLLELLLEAGMEDYSAMGTGEYEVYTSPEGCGAMKAFLEKEKFTFKGQIAKVAIAPIPVDLDTYRKVIAIMEELEEHDDTQEVYADFDVSPEVLAAAGD
ncbi:MAG: YebC/PmpR family DNA-binding transcriptional regulator [Planctomycetota bacterium]